MNRKNNGFTLVEAVTAAAIIAVCAAMLWTGYRSTLAAMRASADLLSDSGAAFALTQKGGEISGGSVCFRAGETLYTVEGEFVRGQSGRAALYAFRPGGGAP